MAIKQTDVSCKFYVVMAPVKSTAGGGKISSVNFISASKMRPVSSLPPGALIVEVELDMPADLFSLKAKAQLTADAAISIASLKEIERSLGK